MVYSKHQLPNFVRDYLRKNYRHKSLSVTARYVNGTELTEIRDNILFYGITHQDDIIILKNNTLNPLEFKPFDLTEKNLFNGFKTVETPNLTQFQFEGKPVKTIQGRAPIQQSATNLLIQINQEYVPISRNANLGFEMDNGEELYIYQDTSVFPNTYYLHNGDDALSGYMLTGDEMQALDKDDTGVPTVVIQEPTPNTRTYKLLEIELI